MNDHTAILDQADEEALVCDISDEALEAAAGTGRGAADRLDTGNTGGIWDCLPC